MTNRRTRALSAAVSILAALVIALTIYSRAQAEMVGALLNTIGASYERAFYETASLMNNIEINLEKAQVAGSDAHRLALLTQISRDAASAQNSLAALPGSLEAIAESLKFVNQTGDVAAVLTGRLSGGVPLSEEDLELLARLHGSCVGVNNLIDRVIERIESGQNPLAEARDGLPVLSAEHVQLESVEIDYPILLYDGPFSDGREEASMPLLEGETISPEQALEAARSFVGADRVSGAWITGEGSVPAPCYEISLYTEDGLLSLALTKRGGHVVYMMVDGAAKQTAFSQGALIDMAASFLKSRGYPPVSVSYWSVFNNYLTVNFAVVQDGVVLYPDLIKVQMSMESGLPVGLEAVNYLSNHTERRLSAPTLDQAEARARLNPALTVARGRLCVIPQDDDEALCWEFSVEADGVRYLVYIDALSGEELNIYRVVEDENGQLVI